MATHTITATHKITATLIVRGEHIQSKKAALNELQIMLDAYDDMNDSDSSVCIKIEKVEKETKNKAF